MILFIYNNVCQGCVAIAKSTEICINDPEVANVNWFTHKQIKKLIKKFQYRKRNKKT